jgi:hypothetical protein
MAVTAALRNWRVASTRATPQVSEPQRIYSSEPECWRLVAVVNRHWRSLGLLLTETA